MVWMMMMMVMMTPVMIPTSVNAGSVRKKIVTTKFFISIGEHESKKWNYCHRPANIRHSETSRPAMGPTHPTILSVSWFLPGGKAAGR
jgi:hypothetical protein